MIRTNLLFRSLLDSTSKDNATCVWGPLRNTRYNPSTWEACLTSKRPKKPPDRRQRGEGLEQSSRSPIIATPYTPPPLAPTPGSRSELALDSLTCLNLRYSK